MKTPLTASSMTNSHGQSLLFQALGPRTDFTLEHVEHLEYVGVAFKRTCGLTPAQYRQQHRS